MKKSNKKDTAPWWSSIDGKHSIKNKKQGKLTSLTAVFAFTAIVGSMVAAVSFAPDPNAPRPSTFNSTLYPADALATLGQCGGIFEFDVPQEFIGKLPDSFFDNPHGAGTIERTVPVQPMTVPAYGYFIGERTSPPKEMFNKNDKKSIPKSFEQLNYMWNGWTIVWYDPEIGADVTSSIDEYLKKSDKVMAIPWMDSARQLPNDRKLAFSAWGVTSSCERWDSRLLDSFIEFSSETNKNRDISTPPKAKLNSQGELYLIEVPK